MDGRLAQPGGGEKPSFCSARQGNDPAATGQGDAGPGWAGPATVRLVERVGISWTPEADDASAEEPLPGRVVALLVESAYARSDVATHVGSIPGLAGRLRLIGNDGGAPVRFFDVGPFSLGQIEAAAAAAEPLAALAGQRIDGEAVVYAQLCRKFGVPFIDLDRRCRSLGPPGARAIGHARAMVFERAGTVMRVVAPPLDQLAGYLEDFTRHPLPAGFAVTTPRCLERHLRREMAVDVEAATTSHLWRVMPRLSARSCPSLGQALLIPTVPALTILGLVLGWRPPLLVIFFLSVMTFLALAMLRLWAYLDVLKARPSDPPVAEGDLPVYSVLVAVYHEAHMMGQLVAALDRLDYPRDRLDILLLLEADDMETRAAAVRLTQGRPHMRVVVVPPGAPRTKPRALSYGFAFARGDLVTVYDAEDRPEPDQLRKAAAALMRGPDHLACVQARLDIAGANGWLERQFAMEYACLFRAILPWLGRLELPLPLGGTSNHFKRQALEVSGGWDPYNVTEDADLGVRLSRFGFTCGVLDSATLENAPARLDVWLRQRRRWIKGWLVTWFVHMRRPRRLGRDLGLRSALVFHLHMTANVLAPLAHPVWLASLVAYASGCLPLPEELSFLDTLVITASALCVIAGYGGNFMLGWRVLGVIGRPDLRRELALQPVYWLLSSWAAWRALWEILTHPHFWDKTPHEVACEPTAAGEAPAAGVSDEPGQSWPSEPASA